MTAGRKPVPQGVRELRGTDRADRSNPDEPKPPVELPDPPAHLTPTAIEVWYRVGRALVELRVLTAIDLDAFGSYCTLVSRVAELERKIKVDDYKTVGSSGTPIQNPEVRTLNELRAQLLRHAVEFGLTPSSRSRIRTVKEQRARGLDSWLTGGRKPH